MIFGKRGHREFQGMSAKKTEVGDMFNPSLKEMKCMIFALCFS